MKLMTYLPTKSTKETALDHLARCADGLALALRNRHDTAEQIENLKYAKASLENALRLLES